MLRLDKYLSDCGVGTRSEIKKLIRSGAVRVDGVNKATPDTKIDETSAIVYLNGRIIKYRKYVYLMLNKPQGYVSAVRDNHYKTVVELVTEEYKHFDVFPMGRLDIDTVGLLVLTNDGEMAHKLLSPAKHVPKKYIAEVDGRVEDSDIACFKSGMDLGDFTAKPAELKVIENTDLGCVAEVTIAEGKFHQIKRMFEKVGKKVLSLKRIQMNNLVLDETLKEGELRELTENELKLLSQENKHTKEENK